MDRALNPLRAVATALLDPTQDEHSQTVPLVFPKPLDAEQALMIELITDRYEGAGVAQFVKVENESSVTLHVPKIIRRVPAQLAGRAVS
jgi:hypothetical protein